MTYTIDESLSDTDFTPAEVVAAAFGTARRYESITVHHWGSFGQTHMGVVGFFLKPNSPTSCHFVASDSLIHCLVSPLDASWAAGNAYGNATSIHIEARPEATDGDYATVAWLIAHLRSLYGDLPLKPHSDWAATACPGKWDLARLDREARNNPTPVTIQEDEMALTPAQDAKLTWLVDNLTPGKEGTKDAGGTFLQLADTQAKTAEVLKKLQDLADNFTPGKEGTKHAGDTFMQLAQLDARLSALNATIDVLATANGLDPAGLQETITAAIEKSLAKLTITLEGAAQ